MTDIPQYTGQLPSHRGQSQAQFDANAEALINWMVSLPTPIQRIVSEVVALVDARNYNPATTYNQTGYIRPSAVYGSNGRTYICVGNNVVGDNPVGSVTANWQSLTLTIDDLYDVVHNDIIGGDITVSGSTLTIAPCGCWDSARSIWRETTENKTLVLPSGAGTESDLWLIAQVRLVADSSITFKYYADQAAIDADATINAHRIIDFAQNNSAGTAAKAFYTKNGIHWNLKASESAVNSMGAIPANCNTAIDLSAFLPPAVMVDEVLMGGQSATALCYVALGVDGTNTHHSFQTYDSSMGDADIFPWYYAAGAPPQWIPVQGTMIYWGDGTYSNTSTANLLLHAVKLRR